MDKRIDVNADMATVAFMGLNVFTEMWAYMELVDKAEAGNKWLIGLSYAVGCSVCTENHLYEC